MGRRQAYPSLPGCFTSSPKLGPHNLQAVAVGANFFGQDRAFCSSIARRRSGLIKSYASCRLALSSNVLRRWSEAVVVEVVRSAAATAWSESPVDGGSSTVKAPVNKTAWRWTQIFFVRSYLPLATNALQSLYLEQQAKAPSLTLTWQYPSVLLVEGKPRTTNDTSETWKTAGRELSALSKADSDYLEVLSPLQLSIFAADKWNVWRVGTASEQRSACLQEKFAARPEETNVARKSIHCCCEKNTLSPSFMTKQRSSFALVLQEKWDEPTNKTALGQFRFGFLGAGWFVPPRS